MDIPLPSYFVAKETYRHLSSPPDVSPDTGSSLSPEEGRRPSVRSGGGELSPAPDLPPGGGLRGQRESLQMCSVSAQPETAGVLG